MSKSLSIIEILYVVLFFAAVLAGILTNNLWLPVLPIAGLILVYLLTVEIKILYFITAALIPFSTELDLPGGIGLVFPGELMFLLLTGLSVLYLAKDPTPEKIKNPLTIVILVHLFWILFTGLYAQNTVISIKYLMAKIWFILPFYILPFYVFNKRKDFDRFLKIIVWASIIAGLYVFISHGLEGWTFASRTNVGKPFFRNHVNYACLLLMMIPAAYYLYRKGAGAIYGRVIFIFLVFIYFTYARIAYISIAALFLIYGIYQLRLLRFTMILSTIGVIVMSFYFLKGDRLIHYAPDYESTVSHVRFDRLIEATYQFKDISAMERAYRWMAGLNMIQERPILGFGPANFYSCYQEYSINSFQTYVSDNPEKSGIHNYYLMLWVEQGMLGLLIFLSLIYLAVWKIERLHNSVASPELLQLALSWITIAVVILLLNDMIEVIKFGPFFFMALWIVSSLSHDQPANRVD